MKDDLNKPLYADCKKQKAYKYFWINPVISREKSYEFADTGLTLIGWILIIITIGVIGWLNPFSRGYSFETMLICFVFIIIAEFFYTRKFVYRFGRFRITWEDEELHDDEEASSLCDKDGNFLKTEENRIAAKKSRRAFLVLFGGIIAAVLLYCFLCIGLSYTRVISWHSGEIEEVKQIAQKYDSVFIDDAGRGASVDAYKDGKFNISQQDRKRLWEIFEGSLKCEYVSNLCIHKDSGLIDIGFDTPFGHSRLFWYDDIADAWPAGDPSATVIQLDEHWVYVRMNDGSFF